MNQEGIIEEYRQAIATYQGVSPEQVSLFWKGRVGLYALLEAWSVGPGDEVIIPAFTCVVVSNAILYRGAQPVYADVDRRTFNILPESVEAKITDRTRLIMAQNTFGLPSDLNRLLKIARKHQILVLEDATHGFGSEYNGQLSGHLVTASFFSTQWNKPFSTGIGGFTITQDRALAKTLRQAEDRYPLAPKKTRRSLQWQFWARRNLLKPWVYWPVLSLYRYLSAAGLVTGSSAGEELRGINQPMGYLQRLSPEQAQLGLRSLQTFSKIWQRRQTVGQHYRTVLEELGKGRLTIPADRKHSFLKFPVLVKDRKVFMEAARRAKIPLGDWMLSPIHPIEANWEEWGYQAGSCPNGEYLSKHVVNLLTEEPEPVVYRTITFLRQQKDQILPWED
ncbi:MAG: aminotransferase class I/II-fold pyridoxal phosphate-dependent enzyme [Bacteroidota bacterium]